LDLILNPGDGGLLIFRLSCLLIFVCIPGAAGAQIAPEQQTAVVRTQMRNVRYRFSDSVAVQINSLAGSLIPIGDNECPIFDDKNSFKLHIDTAEIAIGSQDLANLLNSDVFARPDSPLSGVSVSIAKGQLKIKGKLRDKGDLSFETRGVMSAMPDGRIRLHNENIRALHVPVTGLLDAFGIDIADFIKSGKVPGVQSEGNDLILDLEQMLPAPHIEGKVTSIRVESNSIIQTFGHLDGKSAPRVKSGNFMSYQGNRVRFGRLTIDDTDIIVYDLNPSDPLDFFLDHYKEQVAAGYTNVTPSFQLRVHMKDFDKLGRAKPTAKSKQN
jgi:hypothetical protein